nr:MAG TPA: Putative tail fiber protein fold, Tail fiber, receptor [Caudoviricetes sp.]
MSILKSIMHHWNKTTNSYDTLHPETESAQITDWHSGIMASLASTTLGTVVSAVTTDSVLGKLIKLLLDASGVKYLIDTNGYVCFGSLFGGLIIQWGLIVNSNGNTNTYVTLPISVTHGIGVLNVSDAGTNDAVWNGDLVSQNTILITTYRSNGISTKGVTAKWILACF